MVPTAFQTFFATSAAAGATLIGLIFVAISIDPERVFGKSAQFERQLAASAAFTALLNAFFISLAALVPGVGFSIVILIMSALGLVNSVIMVINLIRLHLRKRMTLEVFFRSAFLVFGALVIYGFEFHTAFVMSNDHVTISVVGEIAYLIMGVYGFAIVRAWEVLGADHRGLFSLLLPLVRQQLIGDKRLHGEEPAQDTNASAALDDTRHESVTQISQQDH